MHPSHGGIKIFVNLIVIIKDYFDFFFRIRTAAKTDKQKETANRSFNYESFIFHGRKKKHFTRCKSEIQRKAPNIELY